MLALPQYFTQRKILNVSCSSYFTREQRTPILNIIRTTELKLLCGLFPNYR